MSFKPLIVSYTHYGSQRYVTTPIGIKVETDIHEYHVLISESADGVIFGKEKGRFIRNNIEAFYKKSYGESVIEIINAINTFVKDKKLLKQALITIAEKEHFDFDEGKFDSAENQFQVFQSIFNRTAETSKRVYLSQATTFIYPNFSEKFKVCIIGYRLMNLREADQKELNEAAKVNNGTKADPLIVFAEIVNAYVGNIFKLRKSDPGFGPLEEDKKISYQPQQRRFFPSPKSDDCEPRHLTMQNMEKKQTVFDLINSFYEKQKKFFESNIIPQDQIISVLLMRLFIAAAYFNKYNKGKGLSSACREKIIEIYNFIYFTKLNVTDENLSSLFVNLDELTKTVSKQPRASKVKKKNQRNRRSTRKKTSSTQVQKPSIENFQAIKNFLKTLSELFSTCDSISDVIESIFIEPASKHLDCKISTIDTDKTSKEIIKLKAKNIASALKYIFLKENESSLLLNKIKQIENNNFTGVLACLYQIEQNIKKGKWKNTKKLHYDYLLMQIRDFFILFSSLRQNTNYKILDLESYYKCKRAFNILKKPSNKIYFKDFKKSLAEIISNDKNLGTKFITLNSSIKKYMNITKEILDKHEDIESLFDELEKGKTFSNYPSLCSFIEKKYIDSVKIVNEISKNIKEIQKDLLELMITKDDETAKKLGSILDSYNKMIQERIEPLFNFIAHFNFSYTPQQDKENNLNPFSKKPIILTQFSTNPDDLLALKKIKEIIEISSQDKIDDNETSLSIITTEKAQEIEVVKKDEEKEQKIPEDKTKIRELRAIFSKGKNTTSIAKKFKIWSKKNGLSIDRKLHSHTNGSGHVDVFLCCNGRRVPITLPRHTTWSPGVKNAIVKATQELLLI